MNLGEIELKIYDRLQFNTTPDSAITRRIRGYVNDAHREILGMRGFGIMRRYVLTTTSVANSPFMVMPRAATTIIAIVDRVNNRTLNKVSMADIRYRDPGLLFSGSIPDSYAIIQYAGSVALDPSAADMLYVVSDSAFDGSGLSVTVEGVLSDGSYRKASIAMNGVTAVNISTAISTWVHVTKFYLSGAASGTVSLVQTSGAGTVLASITPGRSYSRYTQVHLSGTPSSAITYYCDVELHVEDMVSVNDEPLILEDYHFLLECGALKREYLRRKAMDQFSVEQGNWKVGLINMGAALRRQGGVSRSGQRNSDGEQRTSYSNPWIPAN